MCYNIVDRGAVKIINVAERLFGGRGAKGNTAEECVFRGTYIRSYVEQAYDCHRLA